MASQQAAAGSKAGQKPDKKEVKILMLHGYTQSGPLFRAKTRALEKLINKHLAPASLALSLVYPTAPNRLRPEDIPGYQPPADGAEPPDSDAWAWFRRDDATGAYRLLPEGMRRLAEALRSAGPVDGVLGFSQGGAVAAMLASALEPGRALPPDDAWAADLRAANGGHALKFAVVYSGFWAPPADLQWLYEPKVRTPTLHFLGGLDTVVDESRSLALVERCEEPVVLTHPGGHYVPISKEWAMPLVGFIHKYAQEKEQEKEAEVAKAQI